MPFVISSSVRWFCGFLLLLSLGFVTACATHDESGSVSAPPAEAAVGAVANPETAPPDPVPSPTPPRRPAPAATPLPTPPPLLPAPTPSPTPTTAETKLGETLSTLITKGHLLRVEGKTLLFAGTGSSAETTSGLFENAIILGRLRSRLNQVPGLPATVSESATVGEATADLTLPADLAPTTMASGIDAALATEGVARVRVRF